MMKRFFALSLCGLLAACVSPPPVAEKGPPIEMKTWCFGRFLVDMPVNAELVDSSNKIGQEIEIKKMSLPEFQQHIAQEVEALKQVKSRYGYDELMEVGENAYVLKGSYVERRAKTRFHTIKFYKFDHGYFFSTSESAYNDELIKEKIERGVKFIQTLRYRADNEVPKEPGICLQNGFIANGENTRIDETTKLQFELKDHPGTVFSVTSANNISERQPALSKKFGVGQILLWSLRGTKTLRSGKRKVNGLPGEEFFWHATSRDNTEVHSYIWEMRGKIGDPDRPHLQFTLNTDERGGEKVSSMATPEVIQLLDSVLETLRLRPVEE
jgi:hypothetical protein